MVPAMQTHANIPYSTSVVQIHNSFNRLSQDDLILVTLLQLFVRQHNAIENHRFSRDNHVATYRKMKIGITLLSLIVGG